MVVGERETIVVGVDDAAFPVGDVIVGVDVIVFPANDFVVGDSVGVIELLTVGETVGETVKYDEAFPFGETVGDMVKFDEVFPVGEIVGDMVEVDAVELTESHICHAQLPIGCIPSWVWFIMLPAGRTAREKTPCMSVSLCWSVTNTLYISGCSMLMLDISGEENVEGAASWSMCMHVLICGVIWEAAMP
mmetsp:Transcript_26741/g.50930  ORF Transcript_26741/g.50930 Transcript_26741/m.50930 type:complete len:190 (-) Transcript_26741:1047-1616(-)